MTVKCSRQKHSAITGLGCARRDVTKKRGKLNDIAHPVKTIEPINKTAVSPYRASLVTWLMPELTALWSEVYSFHPLWNSNNTTLDNQKEGIFWFFTLMCRKWSGGRVLGLEMSFKHRRMTLCFV